MTSAPQSQPAGLVLDEADNQDDLTPKSILDFDAADGSGRRRPKAALIDAATDLADIVWYNRCHLAIKQEIQDGTRQIVDSLPEGKNWGDPSIISKEIWEGALKHAKAVEARLGDRLLENDDFAWGMINGKLSAIRWALGEHWDMLDT